MRALIARVVEWVMLPYLLPEKVREWQQVAELAAKDRERLQQRWVEEVDARRVYKRAYDRAEARRVELEARCIALEAGKTASGLTAAEVERLGLLAMAAGKLSADAAKVVLHGWKSPSRFGGRPAYAEVEHSMGRLAAAVEVMVEADDVRAAELRAHTSRAKQRIHEQATRQS